MLGKSPNQEQRDLFAPLLTDFIDKRHELVLLAERIEWKEFDKEFANLYSSRGRSSMPLRLMIGSLLLKHLYDLGDETLAKEWVMNPYMQYFCGEDKFKHEYPCDPSDLVHFRNRIGEEGAALIMKRSVTIHGKNALRSMVLSDTTVQENNTTFPTDSKMAKKVIDKCNAIAQKQNVEQRQTYTRTSKQLLRDTHNSKHPKRAKRAKKAAKKLRVLAGRQLRELIRKLPSEKLEEYKQEIELMQRAITQQRHDTNKVYSLHKPETACIAKGKSHKQYEFGNKVGLVACAKTLVITAIQAFAGNPHDSKTIAPLLKKVKDNTATLPKELIYDRGGKGAKEIDGVLISIPAPPKKTDSKYEKNKKRKKFRRRAAIEPLIGHLKTDHRMDKNYLFGMEGAQINALLSAAAWNFKKFMQTLIEDLSFFNFLVRSIIRYHHFQTVRVNN